MDELGELIEQKFNEIPLQENQEKIIFGICAVIDNNNLKVVSDVFVSGNKISIVKVINTLKDDENAKEFNDVINYFKNNENE